jgi:hypothetical protein
MDESDDATRAETLAKLAQSRAEIRRVLEPAPPRAHHSGPQESHIDETVGAFPRSRTMRLLMSGRGLGAVGAVVAGLALARPALILRLLRVLPTGAVARMLAVKAVTALRNRRE